MPGDTDIRRFIHGDSHSIQVNNIEIITEDEWLEVTSPDKSDIHSTHAILQFRATNSASNKCFLQVLKNGEVRSDGTKDSKTTCFDVIHWAEVEEDYYQLICCYKKHILYMENGILRAKIYRPNESKQDKTTRFYFKPKGQDMSVCMLLSPEKQVIKFDSNGNFIRSNDERDGSNHSSLNSQTYFIPYRIDSIKETAV